MRSTSSLAYTRDNIKNQKGLNTRVNCLKSLKSRVGWQSQRRCRHSSPCPCAGMCSDFHVFDATNAHVHPQGPGPGSRGIIRPVGGKDRISDKLRSETILKIFDFASLSSFLIERDVSGYSPPFLGTLFLTHGLLCDATRGGGMYLHVGPQYTSTSSHAYTGTRLRAYLHQGLSHEQAAQGKNKKTPYAKGVYSTVHHPSSIREHPREATTRPTWPRSALEHHHVALLCYPALS